MNLSASSESKKGNSQWVQSVLEQLPWTYKFIQLPSILSFCKMHTMQCFGPFIIHTVIHTCITDHELFWIQYTLYWAFEWLYTLTLAVLGTALDGLLFNQSQTLPHFQELVSTRTVIYSHARGILGWSSEPDYLNGLLHTAHFSDWCTVIKFYYWGKCCLRWFSSPSKLCACLTIAHDS